MSEKIERYPRLAAAVAALGKNRAERAKALEVKPKTLDRLLVRLPQQFAPFIIAPELLRALADDLEHASRDAG